MKLIWQGFFLNYLISSDLSGIELALVKLCLNNKNCLRFLMLVSWFFIYFLLEVV